MLDFYLVEFIFLGKQCLSIQLLFYFKLQRDRVLYDNCNIILILLCTIQTLILCRIVILTIHSLIYSTKCKTILWMLH
ncbi:hypothetical protein DSECCO2_365170 [anaerobic digester metagenome]